MEKNNLERLSEFHLNILNEKKEIYVTLLHLIQL